MLSAVLEMRTEPGVLAGLTSIGEVHGYVIDEGTKSPIEGKLRYREVLTLKI